MESGEQKDSNTFPTLSLSTWAAKGTLTTEYGDRLIC